MANSVDPDQTAPIGAVCSGSTLFASILNSIICSRRLQQTTFSDAFFLGALRVKTFLLYDVASGNEITPCNKIHKPLVVYRFSGNVDVHNNVAYIMTKL